MLPVEISDVPVDSVKDFIDVPGNKLGDAWYWCSNCDNFTQHPIIARPSQQAERALQTISSFISDW
jgi:hypothetical protein